MTEERDNLKSKPREVKINSSSKKRLPCATKSWFDQAKQPNYGKGERQGDHDS